MSNEDKLRIFANKLLGEYIGTLQGVCSWDIHPDLEKTLMKKVKELKLIKIEDLIKE
tara:strand:- start:48 stop:218 length:171 start_codon:yes stop_codon:yes gene_type:complete